MVGFVARGDSVVLTLWLSLWINDYVTEHGGTADDATAKAGIITGIAQTCGLLTAPIAGFLCSRLGTVWALAVMAFIALVGYCSIGLVGDPTSTAAVIISCLIGMGEIGVVVTGQALVTQQSPRYVRGSVGGAFSFSGSIGIIAATKFGGIMYDHVGRGTPFVLFAAFNLLVVVTAVILRLRHPNGSDPSAIVCAEDQKGLLSQNVNS
eukprot:NODE_2964_length_1079_cov_28.596117_g2719_i0.p2 GENE.NODE_2964_length_1079_cov_28.596117_g2719_i0~~NODE_2964_length_1079_cov_28.596117_g2719_i0.p2  ORF type:complete len:226 (+),score=42.30 NODE_2964_length_1079_cov_28.596117_g2719_i0:56-679(+)